MTDLFEHVSPGQPIRRIRAATWNALMDDARRSRAPGTMFDSGGVRGIDFGETVWVKNTSGETLERFSVAGIEGVVIDPADNLTEFKRLVALTVTTPEAGSHDDKFVVLAEPIVDGRLGRAWVTGVCVVQIDVGTEGLPAATITDADATQLTAAPAGPAQIIYVESGTGTKWAVVRLGGVVGTAYQLTPCDGTRDTRYVSYFLDAGERTDAPADDTVIEIEDEGCYTVTSLSPADALCITPEKCVTIYATAESCEACGSDDCGGDAQADGSASGEASEEDASDAAFEDALADAQSDCGDRGVRITSCDIETNEDEPDSWSATATVCYVCVCPEGEDLIPLYRYTCSEGDLVEEVYKEICDAAATSSEECP